MKTKTYEERVCQNPQCNKPFSIVVRPKPDPTKYCSCKCVGVTRKLQNSNLQLKYKSDPKKYIKSWYQNNKERLKGAREKYYQDNKEKLREQNRVWIKANKVKIKIYNEANKDKIKEQNKAYRARPEVIARRHEWLANHLSDPQKKLIWITRRQMSNIIKRAGLGKDIITGKLLTKQCLELLGCAIDKVVKHIEAQFEEGMAWDNYGYYSWHIDHIKPCDAFDLTDPAQRAECFHYTNLQPLWAEDNLAKGAKCYLVD